MVRKFIFSSFCLLLSSILFSQSSEQRLKEIVDSMQLIEDLKIELFDRYNQVSYSIIQDDLQEYGLPSKDFLTHKAFAFEYSEEHEQAKWVAHVITPDVVKLGVKRTNDFRVDPLVSTGTTDSIDYYAYDGSKEGDKRYFTYGYDRGHLAPSADFRWSKEALSESYYYSNISPQAPGFNRGKWADLEGFLRKYVITKKVKLLVITAPILREGLPKIEQSPNGVSIPEQFIKVAYDPVNKQAIGFIMDNKELTESLRQYAVSVDEVEKVIGYDLFANVSENIEAEFDESAWFDEGESDGVEPLDQASLPFQHFNTIAGIKQAGSKKRIHVCGTVVDSRYSRKGHAWLNLDKKYPNQIFSIMIPKEEIENFSFDPIVQYVNKELCFEGEVEKWGDTVVMKIAKPEEVDGL